MPSMVRACLTFLVESYQSDTCLELWLFAFILGCKLASFYHFIFTVLFDAISKVHLNIVEGFLNFEKGHMGNFSYFDNVCDYAKFHCVWRYKWYMAIEQRQFRWPRMTFKVIHTNASLFKCDFSYCCAAVHRSRNLNWHSASRGPPAIAELLVLWYKTNKIITML